MTTETTDRPGTIDARPVRHPGRWVAVAFIGLLTAMLVNSFVTNEKWDWGYTFEIMQQKPVIEGLIKGTLLGTVLAMVIGVVLGIVLAIMRMSENVVLRGVAFAYTWFFRSIPRYVLLGLFAVGLGYLYNTFEIGIPFTDIRFFTLDYQNYSSTVWVGGLALGLSEAAYMAEIARAGILSVDNGQGEAAQALGMSPRQTMRRIVLPQAMRVIVPPTGNETIAMVKDTSLFIAAQIIVELYYQATLFGSRSFKVMPGLMAATLWYLIVCTILMIGQSYLEKRFGRGFGVQAPTKRERKVTALLARTGDH
ncbi:amino acid ABC transporter permease [Nostocoides australiense]|nr:amino acid ABC transporter permease [Actinomycetota bacterium]MCB1302397.1 amino acid ABC transporter permease [Tetrasphaera sp.]HPF80275.1 amino acid ABC transporter permease [Tetrasphaera australiensis]HRW00341.1 amino acid ABC transporter permease [Tetrasphaera sp.]